METKTCTRCHEEKDIDEFTWRRKKLGERSPQCNPCRKKTQREGYQRNKENIKRRVKDNKVRHRQRYQEWKDTLSCEVCGESEACCLDFHHLDPTQKDNTISYFVDYSFERVLQEAKKCVVVCSNCHRKIHNKIIMLE